MKTKQIQRFTIRESEELRLLKLGMTLVVNREYSEGQMAEQMVAIDLLRKLNKAQLHNVQAKKKVLNNMGN